MYRAHAANATLRQHSRKVITRIISLGSTLLGAPSLPSSQKNTPKFRLKYQIHSRRRNAYQHVCVLHCEITWKRVLSINLIARCTMSAMQRRRRSFYYFNRIRQSACYVVSELSLSDTRRHVRAFLQGVSIVRSLRCAVCRRLVIAGHLSACLSMCPSQADFVS